ncbi:MAG: hypothetical protein GWN58_23455 [Anaerolineae bacterium]|nr:hypothetical protein [Thermoplasmata archaeon]NIV32288.1 hypothetical protein [Anaerolineae bacterium]NIY03742.1 hypothetical protein [Thermoplasmata archaeon]
MNTALFDQRVNRRWQDRGGTNPPKRSGRFTKKGPRPRAASLAEAKKRRQELIDKVEQAMPATYSLGDLNDIAIYHNPWLDRVYPSTGGDIFTAPTASQPTWIDNSGTGSYTVSGNSVYLTGVTHDITSAGTLDTTASVTFGTTASDVTTNSNIIINPTINPVSIDWGAVQRQNQQRANDAGLSVDEFFGASDFVPGRTNIQFDTHIRIVANDAVPPGQVFVEPNIDQNGWFYPASGQWIPLDPRQRLRQQMAPQRPPCRADGVSFQNCSPAELTALSLLKKMVDEPSWRTYLKYGFVDVQGKSGLRYQIRRGEWHVLVRQAGKMVAELCVGLSARSQMPPTDEVIARMIMAECDEPELWRRANVDIKAEHRRYHSNPQNHEHMERLVAAA